MRGYAGNRPLTLLFGLLVSLLGLHCPAVLGAGDDFPAYKPSSRAPAAMDIRSSAYGASADAPEAADIGEQITDFSVPRAGGGLLSLREARRQGPVVIIFYRGHW